MFSNAISRAAIAAATLATFTAHAAVLYDNGSPSTGPVASNGTVAPTGTTWSESNGGTIGWTSSSSSSGTVYGLADDFSIAAGSTWNVSSIDVLAYVTDVSASAASPIRSVTLRIWSGTPGTAGAALVWGDYTTNRLTGSTFSNIYRAELGFPEPQRPIWDNTVDTAGLALGAGTYWVEWTTSYLPDLGRSYGVPVYMPGVGAKPDANGMQSSRDPNTGTTTWSPVIDSGINAQQDLPFIVNGTVAAVPEPASWALLLAGAGVLALRRRAPQA
jgi:hypothetical protein